MSGSTPITGEAIREAIDLLQEKPPLARGKKIESLMGLARMVAPDSLHHLTVDTGDFHRLLSEPRFIAEAERAQALASLRVFEGFSEKDPEGVKLQFEAVMTTEGNLLAVTKIIPNGVDTSQKAPIVFAGGLFHKTSVYLDFLTQLSILTEREVMAFDSPGVGGSFYGRKSINHEKLSESLRSVIETLYPDNRRKVIVMGHSLGSITVRNLYHEQSQLNNRVERFVMIAPVPAAREGKKGGLHLRLAYMADGTLSMVKNFGWLEAGARAFSFYGQEHDLQNEWPWIQDRIGFERFPAGPIQYLGLLAQISKQSILDEGELGTDPRLKVVLAEKDHVMGLKEDSIGFWEGKGAVVVRGADHSFIAGESVSSDYVEQVANVIDH